MARIEQKYSRTRIHGENRTEVFENQNSWRESNGSIRESEFMVRIGQKYSRIRIHGENRTNIFENQNSCRESNRSIRELELMSRIGQKYSRIRIHVENRTKYSRISSGGARSRNLGGGGAFEGQHAFWGGARQNFTKSPLPSLPKFLTPWIFFHTFFPKFFHGHF